jgi:hypothetical protein
VALGLLGLAKEKLAVADLRVRDGQVSIEVQRNRVRNSRNELRTSSNFARHRG